MCSWTQNNIWKKSVSLFVWTWEWSIILAPNRGHGEPLQGLHMLKVCRWSWESCQRYCEGLSFQRASFHHTRVLGKFWPSSTQGNPTEGEGAQLQITIQLVLQMAYLRPLSHYHTAYCILPVCFNSARMKPQGCLLVIWVFIRTQSTQWGWSHERARQWGMVLFCWVTEGGPFFVTRVGKVVVTVGLCKALPFYIISATAFGEKGERVLVWWKCWQNPDAQIFYLRGDLLFESARWTRWNLISQLSSVPGWPEIISKCSSFGQIFDRVPHNIFIKGVEKSWLDKNSRAWIRNWLADEEQSFTVASGCLVSP